MKRRACQTAFIAAVCMLFGASQARAQDEDVELWFNPSVTKKVGDLTSIELETAQRLRVDPRDDTYFTRLWVNREDRGGREWSVGAEQRWNGPDEREVRLLQQVGYNWGPLAFRTRMEQRFVNLDARTGLRIRQRLGMTLPLASDEDGWAITGDAEIFVTLRSTELRGQTGLTGLRTFVGFERGFGRYEVSLGYLRQQDIRDDAEDRIGHAPFLGLAAAF